MRCRYEKAGVTREIVDAYRLPQLVLGWEWGLLRFLRARVAGTFRPLPSHTLQTRMQPSSCMPSIIAPRITSRNAAAAAAPGCPLKMSCVG